MYKVIIHDNKDIYEQWGRTHTTKLEAKKAAIRIFDKLHEPFWQIYFADIKLKIVRSNDKK